MSSLESQSFSASVSPGDSAVSVLPCVGSTATEHALGFLGLSHRGSRLRVTHQGDPGGHAVGWADLTWAVDRM